MTCVRRVRAQYVGFVWGWLCSNSTNGCGTSSGQVGPASGIAWVGFGWSGWVWSTHLDVDPFLKPFVPGLDPEHAPCHTRGGLGGMGWEGFGIC